MAKLGEYDGMMDMWYRPERDKFFIFAEPTEANKIVLFKRKDNPATCSSYDELKRYTIGIVRGYVNPPQFDAMIHEFKVEVADGDITNIKKLLAERMDLVLMDLTVGWHLINSLFSDQAHLLASLPTVLKDDPIHIGFSKATPDGQIKADAFNRGVKMLRESGEYQAILKKHGLNY